MALHSDTIGLDKRNINTGHRLPKESYCDQPYVVITQEGHWLCVMTTGQGHEGDRDQHIVSTISVDQGKTWSPLVDIEPSGPPEASWVTPLIVPSGRVYVFYTYNGNNMSEVKAETEGAAKRVDTLGDFAFKYSDDGGRSWSSERYTIPVRVFEIDKVNPYGGDVRFFWSVCKPIVHREAVYIGLAKVGRFGIGFMESSEGAFVRSDNLLNEPNPMNIRWETLPDGDVGLRAPASPVADEHNLVGLDNGDLYCTYRTTEGYNCHAYSRDGGHSWTAPQHAEYSPGGRKIKHPRAANFVRKFSNCKYLLWFHNHGMDWSGGLNLHNQWQPYANRNPVWLSGGIEREGHIHWSEPEIALYANDPDERMSYPDFIEENGRYFITETQKTIARCHEIDPALLEGMWRQSEHAAITSNGLIVDWRRGLGGEQARITIPRLPSLKEGGGFSIDGWIQLDTFTAGQVILDTRDARGIGLLLQVSAQETIELVMSDGRSRCAWDCDQGLLKLNTKQHFAVIVDGGPKLITFVVDGQLCDGGSIRQFGWGRFSSDMREVNGLEEVGLSPSLQGELLALRIYDTYLRTSEAVGNYRAGFID